MKTPSTPAIITDFDLFFLQHPIAPAERLNRKVKKIATKSVTRSHKKLPFAKTRALENELLNKIAQSILTRAENNLNSLKRR